jgi:allantoinase
MPIQSRKWSLVYTVVIHPFIIGHPFRLRALRRTFAHIAKARDNVWLTTPGAVATHFTAVNPPPPR